ncbi:MAG: DUF721 domain-containing protein [Bdellovibrionales bacterium]
MSSKKVLKRASALTSVDKVLQSLLQSSKSPLADQFLRWRLWSSWDAVVGEEIAKHCMPVGFLNGTLYIWVKSSARMQEMIFLVKPIQNKINEHIGNTFVNAIRFTLDRKSVPVQAEQKEALKDDLNETLEESLSEID